MVTHPGTADIPVDVGRFNASGHINAMKNLQRIMFAALLVFVISVAVTWLVVRPHDPLFRGKPESYWVEHLSYRDEEQVKQWREFGSAGVRVLVRALHVANRPAA